MGGRSFSSGPARRSPRGGLATIWLVVAAIFAHALLPAGSPLQRTAGSAFSATTVDVTTIPRRLKDRVLVDADCRGRRTDAAAGAGVCDTAPAEAIRLAAPPARRALARGVPPRLPDGAGPASPYEARAPPLSLLALSQEPAGSS